ncbi:ATP-binding protein [Chachezhania antarctica]|nr:ATP-binding protein [Chachezhania antarctica]
MVATAILDRLLHYSHVVTVRGDSRIKPKTYQPKGRPVPNVAGQR